MSSTNRKLRVFLCHAKEDKPIVREIYRQLIAEGWLDVWLDDEKLLPGQEWDIEIEKAVEQADVVLVCLSNKSVDKEGYVQKEIRFVLNIADEKPESTIFVIPLRLDDCVVPRRLRTWQWTDYFPKGNQKIAYARLLKSLNLRAAKLDIESDKDTLKGNLQQVVIQKEGEEQVEHEKIEMARKVEEDINAKTDKHLLAIQNTTEESLAREKVVRGQKTTSDHVIKKETQYPVKKDEVEKKKEPGWQNNNARRVGRIFRGGSILFVLFVGFWFTYQFASSYLIHKNEIVFLPDVPIETSGDLIDLNQAAQILNNRSQLLGYTGVLFDVSNNGEIVGEIPVAINLDTFVAKISIMGLVEFVDFGESPPSEGSTVRTDFNNKYVHQIDGQEWHTIMSNREIKTASVDENSHTSPVTYEINFTLTEAGKKIFSDHTSQNVSNYLGIVLDKVVIWSPIINSPITGGEGTIQGNFTDEEAQTLAVILQTEPLPSPIILKPK